MRLRLTVHGYTATPRTLRTPFVPHCGCITRFAGHTRRTHVCVVTLRFGCILRSLHTALRFGYFAVATHTPLPWFTPLPLRFTRARSSAHVPACGWLPFRFHTRAITTHTRLHTHTVTGYAHTHYRTFTTVYDGLRLHLQFPAPFTFTAVALRFGLPPLCLPLPPRFVCRCRLRIPTVLLRLRLDSCHGWLPHLRSFGSRRVYHVTLPFTFPAFCLRCRCAVRLRFTHYRVTRRSVLRTTLVTGCRFCHHTRLLVWPTPAVAVLHARSAVTRTPHTFGLRWFAVRSRSFARTVTVAAHTHWLVTFTVAARVRFAAHTRIYVRFVTARFFAHRLRLPFTFTWITGFVTVLGSFRCLPRLPTHTRYTRGYTHRVCTHVYGSRLDAHVTRLQYRTAVYCWFCYAAATLRLPLVTRFCRILRCGLRCHRLQVTHTAMPAVLPCLPLRSHA